MSSPTCRSPAGRAVAGVYSELRGFVLAHRSCAGPRHADVDPLTPNGYRLLTAIPPRMRMRTGRTRPRDEMSELLPPAAV
jgi:hypothetical protein